MTSEDGGEAGEFPSHLIPEMADLGMFGMHLEGYGCAGLGPVEYGMAALELEAGDSGLRSFISVQGSLCMFPIHKYGSEEQKLQWLPQMARGEVLGCFGLTEPDAGSDPGLDAYHRPAGGRGLDHRWHESLDHQRRSGRPGRDLGQDNPKVFGVFWCQPMLRDSRRIPSNVRPACAPRLLPPWFWTGVRLPEEMMLPGVASMRGASLLSDRGSPWDRVRRHGAAPPAPATRRPWTTPSGRVQFGVPISSFQLTQAKLVEMMVAVQRGTLLAIRIGRLREEGKLTPEQVSLGK